MWGQDWMSISELLMPFPEKPKQTFAKKMRAQNYTVEKMYRVAEDFFVSLNFSSLPESFWKLSMLKKPADGRRVMCQPSAWDFCDTQDFRIKMCTEVSFKDLLIVTHEVGHIQYYMEYSGQPFVFRQGAKPAFHEAVGDTMVLSLLTPEHLERLGLVDPKDLLDNDEQKSLNFLMEIALKKLPLVAFSYVMYKWRHDVMSKTYSSEQLNCRWWELREKFEGVKAPSKRSEEDFDPGSKWHVVADLPFLRTAELIKVNIFRYQFSKILEFQFHKALCEAAGKYPTIPLHKCSIYGNAEAGEKFRTLLKAGYSEAWEDTLEDMTGVADMDVRPLLEYFKPLHDYLVAENARTGETVGWTKGETRC
ncbi:unnamed protein product [Notodromas monacha]|uniref:Angiotensin-converting enzyme n=1 Tax=Notodromas monacha TaxID=399045 RepID=A0A7R9G9R1_9CRUS|nr:unnamed protein product [Notodromas monacha]CAG0914498.1 unnamed protein product [Notodromas monacha]